MAEVNDKLLNFIRAISYIWLLFNMRPWMEGRQARPFVRRELTVHSGNFIGLAKKGYDDGLPLKDPIKMKTIRIEEFEG